MESFGDIKVENKEKKKVKKYQEPMREDGPK